MEPMARVCKYKLRLSQAATEARGDASPTLSVGDDFESVYDMSEGEVDFNESETSDMEDIEPSSPKQGKSLLSKIGGWWTKA